ncbi:MAG: glutathione S-transferase family protein [Alphaproteobacteria bacterium]|nr:glutathione S-transferase family protein [Alphaproteobacteria bacterium]
MAPHAALEEIGAPYELKLLDTAKGEHKRPEYLKLNPNGRVPTLLADGKPIYESAAITMLLADRHPEAKLAPAVPEPDRLPYLQWMAYMTNTVQEAYMQFFHADYFAAAEASRADVKATAERRLPGMFAVLEGALDRGPYLLGERFSAADLYLFMLTRWGRNLAKPAWDYPKLGAHWRAVGGRPAVQRMMKAAGLA